MLFTFLLNPAPIGGGYQVSRTEPIRQNTFSSQGIGFQFLARMLRSKDSPDGCPKLMFQSVALSVLSCFANEAEIMTHPSVSTWNINFRDFSVKGQVKPYVFSHNCYEQISLNYIGSDQHSCNA